MLSILIPSHRPHKLQACLQSIQNAKIPVDYEVLIESNSGVSDLSEVYMSLLGRSKGSYIYYLEDDDLLLTQFSAAIQKIQELDIDLAICNYYGYLGPGLDFYQPTLTNFQKFKETFAHYRKFQLGRIIFKKSILSKFPRGNNLLNDWHLFTHLNPKNFYVLPYVIYKQTKDDSNISFHPKAPYFESEISEMEPISCK